MQPKISIIIPFYNRFNAVKRALQSVVCQTFKNYEVLLINDGSTNKPPKELTLQTGKIRYLNQPHQGVSAARNTGIIKAKSPFIAFLDSDDTWHPDKLSIQYKAMKQNPQYLISHTNEKWLKHNRLVRQPKEFCRKGGYLFKELIKRCVVSPSTVMTRKVFFDCVGMFDPNLTCCEDFDLWVRAGASLPFLLINQSLTIKYGGKSDQLSYIHRVGMDKMRIQSLTNLLQSNMQLSHMQKHSIRCEIINKCYIYSRGCKKHGRFYESQFYEKMAENYQNLS